MSGLIPIKMSPKRKSIFLGHPKYSQVNLIDCMHTLFLCSRASSMSPHFQAQSQVRLAWSLSTSRALCSVNWLIAVAFLSFPLCCSNRLFHADVITPVAMFDFHCMYCPYRATTERQLQHRIGLLGFHVVRCQHRLRCYHDQPFLSSFSKPYSV